MANLWTNIKKWFSLAVAILITLLTAAFLIEKKQKDDAEEKLLNQKVDAEDKALAAQGSTLEQDSKATEAAAEKEKEQVPTQDELVKDLNNL